MAGRRAPAILRAMNSETFIFIALQLAAVLGMALLALAVFFLQSPTDADNEPAA